MWTVEKYSKRKVPPFQPKVCFGFIPADNYNAQMAVVGRTFVPGFAFGLLYGIMPPRNIPWEISTTRIRSGMMRSLYGGPTFGGMAAGMTLVLLLSEHFISRVRKKNDVWNSAFSGGVTGAFNCGMAKATLLVPLGKWAIFTFSVFLSCACTSVQPDNM